MSDKAFMRRFIETPDSIRSMLISDYQIEMVRLVKDWDYPNITAREVASLVGKELPNVSQQLAKLARMGWLTRKQYTDETGGIYYRYSSAI